MVSSKKKKKKKNKWCLQKKKKKKIIIWVGIQHVRDYRAQGETDGASALARVYSQLFYDSGHDWLFIYFLFVFFFFFFFFICIFFSFWRHHRKI